MIYTVFLDAYSREISVKNKRDCCILLQSLPSLPIGITEYINKTKNESIKKERLFAYTALLYSLKVFFDVQDIEILRNKDGKPYLLYKCDSYTDNSGDTKDNVNYLKKNTNKTDIYLYDKAKIFFNISHSEGIIAVSLSDEGEVGVDIQGEIDQEKEKKLEKRYLYDVSVKKEVIGQKYFILNIFDNHAVFTECDPFDFENCFTAKWTVLESLLKLSAEGFSSISKVADISMSALTQTAKIIVDNKKIMISTSTYRK